MPKEKPEMGHQIYGDIETLSQQTRMRMLLEVFNLGPDAKKNEERKRSFIELMGRYHRSGIRQRSENLGVIQDYDANKKKIHNQIMEIIRNMSLSRGISKDQERLTEYLARNREEVEKMIGVYFLGYNPSDSKDQSEIRQALRGERYFTSPPNKKDN